MIQACARAAIWDRFDARLPFRAANQFTEWGPVRAYHTDRWIVNKVTFYLTFY